MKKCGLYIRVSTQIQAETKEGSLKIQRQRLEAFVKSKCKDEKWKVLRTYEETQSGKDIKRPALQALLADIKNKKVNMVLCTKIDRISRSLLDFYYLCHFFKEYNADFICLDDSFDTSSPIGRMALKMILVFAELEREQTSERTRSCLYQRALKGLWNGGHILGYDLNPENKGYLKINEKESAIVKTAFETYLATNSFRKTCNALNEKGYTTKSYLSKKGIFHQGNRFRPQILSSLLRNQTYIGKLEVNKENKFKHQEEIAEDKRYKIVAGKQEPIINEALFYAVQGRIRQNRRKLPPQDPIQQYEYLFRGIIRCGYCGFALKKKWAGGNGGYYFYYSCICFKHYIPADGLEMELTKALKDFSPSQNGYSRISVQLGQIKPSLIQKYIHKFQRARLYNYKVKILRKFIGRIDYYEDKIEIFLK